MSKIYFVNGAARSGFGETTTRAIIGQGSKVIGIYNEKDAENAKKLLVEFGKEKLELTCIDIINSSALLTFLNSVNSIFDGFVNADFMFEMENVDNFDYQLSEKLYLANFHAPKMMAIELKKKMRKGASIVFVTSTEAYRGSYGAISYASTKAAMHNLVQSLACNWGKKDNIWNPLIKLT